jgi:hypothetical protein
LLRPKKQTRKARENLDAAIFAAAYKLSNMFLTDDQERFHLRSSRTTSMIVVIWMVKLTHLPKEVGEEFSYSDEEPI